MAQHKMDFPQICKELDMSESNFVEKLKEIGPLRITNGLIGDLFIWAKTESAESKGYFSEFKSCLLYIWKITSKSQQKLDKSIAAV